MRELILKMSITLDGFVCGPQGELEWAFKRPDEGVDLWELENLSNAGVHIMGSRTFQDMAAWWPTSNERIAAPMNKIPKVVFTRQGTVTAPGEGKTTQALRDATQDREARGGSPLPAAAADLQSWAEAQIARGDVSGEVEQLKAEDGKYILAHGGASFAQDLVKRGLVDEYRLLVHPVVLGRGLALFSSVEAPRALQHLHSTRFPSGAVASVYKRA